MHCRSMGERHHARFAQAAQEREASLCNLGCASRSEHDGLCTIILSRNTWLARCAMCTMGDRCEASHNFCFATRRRETAQPQHVLRFGDDADTMTRTLL